MLATKVQKRLTQRWIWLDMPGEYIVDRTGESTINMKTAGHEKARVTVMLGAYADGTKMPPMVLFKRVRPPPARDIPAGIRVEMTSNVWADDSVMMNWLQRVWRKNQNGGHRLLVWDSHRAHLTRGPYR